MSKHIESVEEVRREKTNGREKENYKEALKVNEKLERQSDKSEPMNEEKNRMGRRDQMVVKML